MTIVKKASVAACVLSFPLVSVLAGGGAVEGVVTLAGTAPAAVTKAVTTDREPCARESVPDESLLVDPATKGIANAVVTLKPAGDEKAPPPAKVAPIVFDQSHCIFTEHVLIVPTGAEIEFKNSDKVGHNVNVKAVKNRGFNKTISAGESVKQAFDRPERIRVECNIHPWMDAYLVVTDEPYYARTDSKGNFRIEGVKPGTYKVQIWQEKIGSKKAAWQGPTEITVKEGETAKADFAGSLGKEQ